MKFQCMKVLVEYKEHLTDTVKIQDTIQCIKVYEQTSDTL